MRYAPFCIGQAIVASGMKTLHTAFYGNINRSVSI
jgi:hypothetical protein